MSGDTRAGRAATTGREALAARSLGCLAGAAALIVALAVVSAVIIRNDVEPHAFDLGSLVSAGEFRDLDLTATRWASGQAGQIEARAPWLSPEGYAVLDWCELGDGGSSFTAVSVSGVGCGRTLVTYYGFDGSLPGGLGEMGPVLTAAGWSGFASSAPPSGPPLSPTVGTAPPLASEVPPVRADLALPDGVPLKVSMEIYWIGRSRPTSPAAGRSTLPAPVKNMGVMPTTAKNTTFVRFLQLRDADVPSLAKRIFSAHRYMLIIKLYAQYFQNPTLRASTPRSDWFPPA